MDHCHAERSEASLPPVPSKLPFMRSSSKDFLHRKVTDSGTFGYTIEDLYHILFSVLSLLTLR
jgi:hypothetical protein